MPTLLKASPVSFGRLEDSGYLKFEQVSTKRQRAQRTDLEAKLGKEMVLSGPARSSYFDQKEARKLMMESNPTSLMAHERATNMSNFVENSAPSLEYAKQNLRDWNLAASDLTSEHPVKPLS